MSGWEPMVQTNYFVEIRRRALEIDWRVPITIYDEAYLNETAPSDLLLNGRYLRIERDLLVVAPQERGMLFHRYFDPEAQFNGSPLKLKPGQSIPISWAAMMTAAPLFPLDSEKPSQLESISGAGYAIETAGSIVSLALGADYRVSVGPETRLWLTEGSRGKPWTVRMLRGSIFCEAVTERSPPLRVETLRGQGKLFGGGFGAQMFVQRRADLVLATSVGVTGPTRWEMGGFAYSLTGEKPSLAWVQSGGGPDGVGLDALSGRLASHLADCVGRALGRGPDSAAQEIAKPYRAPRVGSKGGQAARTTPADKATLAQTNSDVGAGADPSRAAETVNEVAAVIAPIPNGHAPAIAPIAMLDKPLHTISKFEGDIDLKLSVDQGALYCRRNDLASVEGSGTGALFLRGPLSQVNVTLAAITYEPPVESPTKLGAPQPERRAVMVTVFARIGGRLFESNLPLEQMLTAGGSTPPR